MILFNTKNEIIAVLLLLRRSILYILLSFFMNTNAYCENNSAQESIKNVDGEISLLKIEASLDNDILNIKKSESIVANIRIINQSSKYVEIGMLVTCVPIDKKILYFKSDNKYITINTDCEKDKKAELQSEPIILEPNGGKYSVFEEKYPIFYNGDIKNFPKTITFRIGIKAFENSIYWSNPLNIALIS